MTRFLGCPDPIELARQRAIAERRALDLALAIPGNAQAMALAGRQKHKGTYASNGPRAGKPIQTASVTQLEVIEQSRNECPAVHGRMTRTALRKQRRAARLAPCNDKPESIPVVPVTSYAVAYRSDLATLARWSATVRASEAVDRARGRYVRPVKASLVLATLTATVEGGTVRVVKH